MLLFNYRDPTNNHKKIQGTISVTPVDSWKVSSWHPLSWFLIHQFGKYHELTLTIRIKPKKKSFTRIACERSRDRNNGSPWLRGDLNNLRRGHWAIPLRYARVQQGILSVSSSLANSFPSGCGLATLVTSVPLHLWNYQVIPQTLPKLALPETIDSAKPHAAISLSISTISWSQTCVSLKRIPVLSQAVSIAPRVFWFLIRYWYRLTNPGILYKVFNIGHQAWKASIEHYILYTSIYY